MKFDISVTDAVHLERTKARFAYWGIHYHIVTVSRTKNFVHRQVNVTSLPPSIVERCRIDPRLLIELLRKESWKQDEHDHQNTHEPSLRHQKSKYGVASAAHWFSRFHGCPEGILDMINSRACRSSIMFNDPLSNEECTELVRRLSNCAFPFQCAHGRPSMVPLVDLGGNFGFAAQERKGIDSFGKVFKSWNAK